MADEGRQAEASRRPHAITSPLNAGWFEDAQERFRQMLEMARTIGIESTPTRSVAETADVYGRQAPLLMRGKPELKTPSPRKARQQERERHKADAKKRLLDHRKNLQNVRSTISRSKPSPSFVGHTLETATNDSESSFYVSLKGSGSDADGSRPSAAPRTQRRRSSTAASGVEFVLWREGSTPSTELSKSFPAVNSRKQQKRRPVCLDICDEIAAARRQCLQSLGPDLVAHIRSSLTKGVPLKTHLLTQQEHADAVRLVKRLIYLEDAYYG